MALKDMRVVVGSGTGGGPMQRLADALQRRGQKAEVKSLFTQDRWRELMTRGAVGRIQARLSAFVRFPVEAVADACKLEPTVLVPTTNPFFLPFVLVVTRPLHGRAVVPLVYDLYPDAVEATGMGDRAGLVGRAMSAANRFWFKRADGMVFIGRHMADHARARYGEPRRWTVIETGASVAELDAEGMRATPAETELEEWCDKRVVISYVGNLGRVHDWTTLMEAVPRVVEGLKGRPYGIVIAASGPGVAALQTAWAGLPEDVVRFVPPLPDREWARLLTRSDVSLVTLKPEAKRTSIPSKTLSAMAASNAIVAVAPRDSDLADLIEENGCGGRVEPGDVGGLVGLLTGVINDEVKLQRLRRRARQAVVERYDLDRLAEQWHQLLERTVAERTEAHNLRGDRTKRLFDLVASGAALGLTWPIIAGAAIGIRLTMGGPVLFTQDRGGKGGERFRVIKFKTMREPKSHERGPEYDHLRTTRLGRLLRKTSVDELPTLLNVLKGDMSLVGPRPLLARYLERYSPEEAHRHDVLPGITGWAQINGRNRIGWAEKFELDLHYVHNHSLAMDLYILARTVLDVAASKDIDHDASVSMPEFMGHSRPTSDTAVEAS